MKRRPTLLLTTLALCLAAATAWPDSLDDALSAFNAGRYEAAAQAYAQALRGPLETPTRGMALFNLGLSLKRQGRCDAALKIFQQVVEPEPGQSAPPAAYGNYRGLALWESGHCLRASGDWAGALRAYVAVREKYPLQTCCGNTGPAFGYQYALHEGLCLEHLGRSAEAVRRYFQAALHEEVFANPAADTRLADLYAATGQLDALKAILDAERRRPQPGATATLRRLVALHERAQARDWAALLARIGAGRDPGDPQAASARAANFEAVQAARLLAAHPTEAMPLLLQKLAAAPEGPDAPWLYLALGLCATPAASATLQERAAHETTAGRAGAALYALSLAGPAGATALQSLETISNGVLRQGFDDFHARLRDGDEELAFPPVPKNLKLPERLIG